MLYNITWQLALTKTSRPYDRTAFPIVDEDTPQKMKTFDRITQDIPTEAVDEIKSFQPYQRGEAFKYDNLWKLDKLCNIDKHRVIPAQGTSLDLKIPRGVRPIAFNRLDDAYIVTMPISVKAKMKLAPPPIFDILLGSEVDGLIISIWELPKIYEFVRDTVIPRFSRFFSE